MKKYFYSTLLFLFAAGPVVALAAFDGIQGLMNAAGGVITRLGQIVAGLALLFFFWGLAKFILKAGDEKARDEGKQIMFWGIIALFVLASIWGIVGYLQEDLLGGSDIDSNFFDNDDSFFDAGSPNSPTCDGVMCT